MMTPKNRVTQADLAYPRARRMPGPGDELRG
jgi:hypothetical protein